MTPSNRFLPHVRVLAGAFLLFAVATPCMAEDAEFGVIEVAASSQPLDIAVQVPCDDAEADCGRVVHLFESGTSTSANTGRNTNAPIRGLLVPAIGEDGLPLKNAVRVVASIPPGENQEGKRAFRVVTAPPSQSGASVFQWTDIDGKSLALIENCEDVLTYNYGVITREDLPEKERRRSRACYIHPVWGLSGEILTDDFPRDHYHHHGVFWTWPHVECEGKHYDLWTDVGDIHQRFERFLAKEAGPNAAVLGVENAWYIEGRKAMIERVWIRAYQRTDQTRAIDIDLVFIPVDKPITLKGAAGKSYGGLTVRFHPQPEGDLKTEITVPSGVTKGDLTETKLPWADFTSKFGDMTERSGGAVFISKSHPDYPPTWLTRHYGPLCVGWPGVDGRTFEPDEVIPMSYRLWLHKTPVDTEAIAEAYNAYMSAEEAKAGE